MSLLDFLRPNRSRPEAEPTDERIAFEREPPTIYAIGDVHGCFDLLEELEARVVADAARFPGDKWIVMLGDYIDRGQQSGRVLDHLLLKPKYPGFSRFCLAGNHEVAMEAFVRDPGRNADWLTFGGVETLASYGISPSRLAETRPSSRQMRQLLDSHVPEEHLRFIRSLPRMLQTPSYVFTHAGLRPGVSLAEQTEADLIWARHDFEKSYAGFGQTVVHGHTPIEAPLVLPNRIAIDTGAYLTGRLTAVRLRSDTAPAFLTSGTLVRDPARV